MVVLQKTSRVLIASVSHGVPPTQIRPARARELGRALVEQGIEVDHVVLVERALHPSEEERLRTLAPGSGEMETVLDPSIQNPFRRRLQLLWNRLRPAVVRGGDRCPRSLLGALDRSFRQRQHGAAILCGARLIPAARLLRGRIPALLDLCRLERRLVCQSRRLGREDAVDRGGVPGEEATALDATALDDCAGILVSCADDARALADMGARPPVLVVPPMVAEPVADSRPLKPPRLLVVGSETVANLDGIRWFRKHVLPRVVRAVPSASLRVVGEAARHLSGSPGLERIGWVDNLAKEYGAATVVVLPMRLGGCLHRRAVEALAHGKALALTEAAAHGLELVAGRDAVLSDEAGGLAAGIMEILTNDAVRRRYEARAVAIARERFAPETLMRPLLETLFPETLFPEAARSPEAGRRATLGGPLEA